MRGLSALREFRQQGEQRDEGDRHDGHVDEEYGTPPGIGQQPAAEDRADRERRDGHRDHDRDGRRPLTLGEEGGEHREGERQEEGGRDPEKRARCDQCAGRRRVRAGQRCDPEQDEGSNEQALAPEAIAEQACRQEHGCERERVGVDEPLQVARRG